MWGKNNNGVICFIDEKNVAMKSKSEIVNEENLTITIPSLYLRNGWMLIDELEKNASVIGKVCATDGDFSFVVFDGNSSVSLDKDTIFKDNGLEDTKTAYQFETKEYISWNSKVNKLMDEWINS